MTAALSDHRPASMAGSRVWREPVVAACLLFLGLMVIAAAAGPSLIEWTQRHQDGPRLQAPSWGHWFGTDIHGFDVLHRSLIGARISLLVGITGATVSLVIGVTLGLLSGYMGGAFDLFMMRVVDVFYALPRLVIVIVLMAVVQSPMEAVIRAANPILDRWIMEVDLGATTSLARLLLLFLFLGMFEWMTMCRIVRGQVLVLRELAFVQAAQALGQSHFWILFRHLLPNIASVIIVYLTLTIPVVILEESFLSYLGLGVEPPLASWGTLISDGARQLNPIHIDWWLLVFPAAMMSATLLALNFLGDALRDAFDPRRR
jgi:peptide/nickel transport system permease protein/oligopeptide transport system permease protein